MDSYFNQVYLCESERNERSKPISLSESLTVTLPAYPCNKGHKYKEQHQVGTKRLNYRQAIVIL